jgi:hypothetical protein
VWDGRLISKSARDKLERENLSSRINGFNVLMPKGVQLLATLGFIRA